MGRVFVVQADLTKLVVDDVVVPCDVELNVHPGFADLFGGRLAEGTYVERSYRRPTGAAPVAPGLWRSAGREGHPRVWLVDSALASGDAEHPEERAVALARRLGAALVQVARPIDGPTESPVFRRRIAMPLMGITEGGFRDQYAAVIRATLEELDRLCESADVDIVLSVRDRADYAAVQYLRRKSPPSSVWAEADAAAQRLARLATDGRLVLFIGAGASVGAGLGDWRGLLDTLARAVRLDLTELDDFHRLDPRDQALLIATAPGASELDVPHRIAAAFQGQRYPLTQALLASLRVEQALTTNYDTLYETAHDTGASAGARLRVLPRETYLSGHPWLMKIHGDARVPNSIVLSRDDYIRFDADSVPMASVVQSAMLTSHLLFVGYSVSDENVVRLARQVVTFRRKASSGDDQGSGGSTVGTVLVPDYTPAKARLWEGVLDYAPLPGGRTPPPGTPSDAWWQERTAAVETFLDLLGMHACQQAPYLMVDRYEKLLGPDELAIKRALQSLQDTLARMEEPPGAAAPIQSLLEAFGSNT